MSLMQGGCTTIVRNAKLSHLLSRHQFFETRAFGEVNTEQSVQMPGIHVFWCQTAGCFRHFWIQTLNSCWLVLFCFFARGFSVLATLFCAANDKAPALTSFFRAISSSDILEDIAIFAYVSMIEPKDIQ